MRDLFCDVYDARARDVQIRVEIWIKARIVEFWNRIARQAQVGHVRGDVV